ncbi:MAG: signal peptidase II [Cyanobium sp.]
MSGCAHRHLRWPSLALAAGIVLLDQISKHWANSLLPPGRSLPCVPGLLALQLVHNSGAAFSLFHGSSRPLGLISLVVSAAVLLWILRAPAGGIWLRLGLGFLLGGAIGNGLDRWREGVVTDFLALVPVSFPVFNLADVAINLAVACFLLDQLPMLRGRSGGANGRPRVLGPHAPEPRD